MVRCGPLVVTNMREDDIYPGYLHYEIKIERKLDYDWCSSKEIVVQYHERSGEEVTWKWI